MSWKTILRVAEIFEDKVAPPLAFVVSGVFFFGLLFLNKDPQATLHLMPRDGHFDDSVLIPVFLMAFWALSKYTEKNALAWKLILPAIAFLIGLQFIY